MGVNKELKVTMRQHQSIIIHIPTIDDEGAARRLYYHDERRYQR